MPSFLLTTQQDLVDRLLSDPFFEDVPIISRVKKDLLNEITNSVNKVGLCGTVIIPQATVLSPNLPGPQLEEIKIEVGFCENRITNKTGKTAEECAEKAAALLNHFIPSTMSSALEMDKPSIAEIPPETEADRKLRLIGVRLVGSGGLAYAVPQVALPTAVNNAGVVTLACATPGAAIFYRTDGKHPHPHVGSGSFLYAAPFNVASGAKIRVRGWLAGHLTSELVSLNLN